MKYILFPFLFLCIVRCTYDSTSTEVPSLPNHDIVGHKQAPADHFYFKRTFPHSKFPKKEYLNAIAQAKEVALRKNNLAGFDGEWEVQGPGNAGARINDILVHPSNSDIIYLGYSGGGIFKTEDGGANWYPIFDDFPYLSIGDLSFGHDPQTIYVGTGDPCISGYPFIGDGIYKSTDAGLSWQSLGLREMGIVSKIWVHPADENIIIAGTSGIPFERNTLRGVYKTTDGGQNWTQVLFVNQEAGICDLIAHPTNPDILLAAIWNRIRNNEESIYTSSGPKVFRSQDGGDTWNAVAQLPSGTHSRVYLEASQQNPGKFFALYTDATAEFDGIYSSSDGGTNWNLQVPYTTPLVGNVLNGFGWYLGKLKVNPLNDNEMFVLGVHLLKSEDGGQNWNYAVPSWVHVDNHALVFDAQQNVILGNDGGAYKYSQAKRFWTDIENIPATQVYRTAYNPHQPDQYYGGFQDNGTQVGNKNTISNWSKLRGGDGFQMRFNPDDPEVMYLETQNGGITYHYGNSTQSGSTGLNSSDRRNWDMPYIISPHHPYTLYTGTYRLFRSTAIGQPQWNALSGDLTGPSDQVPPNFKTISTLDESPIEEGLVYVGSSNGVVTRVLVDDSNYTNISDGLPSHYVSSVVASPSSSQTVYVGLSGYKYGNNSPLLYRSDNRGNDWIDISGDLPALSINDVWIMPEHQDSVLFVATDGGVYASKNAGLNWNRLGTNMPLIPVYDIEYNVAHNKLIAATYARSIQSYSLDELLLPSQLVAVGQVEMYNEIPVREVAIYDAQETIVAETDTLGAFSYFVGRAASDSCKFSPKDNTQVLSGVSIDDYLRIVRHYISAEPFTDTYQYLATDMDGNNRLSINDLFVLRDLILRRRSDFENVDSWRFIPKNYVFQYPDAPQMDTIDAYLSCQEDSLAWWAVKMGDINLSVNPNLRSSDFEIEVEEVDLEVGEERIVKFYFPEDSEMYAFEWGLNFDVSKITVENVDTNTELGANTIFQYYLDKNTQEWLSFAGTSDYSPLVSKMPFVAFRITAKEKVRLSECVSLNNESQNLSFFNADSKATIALKFSNSVSLEMEETIEVFPNPFVDNLTLKILSHLATHTQVEVFDVSGKLVQNLNLEIQKGENTINLSDHVNGLSRGLYILKIKNPYQEKTIKLLKST